jgi:hypothetical protein
MMMIMIMMIMITVVIIVRALHRVLRLKKRTQLSDSERVDAVGIRSLFRTMGGPRLCRLHAAPFSMDARKSYAVFPLCFAVASALTWLLVVNASLRSSIPVVNPDAEHRNSPAALMRGRLLPRPFGNAPFLPPACTDDQRAATRRSLAPRSTGQNTRCPVNTWWDEYIYDKFAARALPLQESDQPLLAIFIGCNKGDDAVEALAKLSGDGQVDKSEFSRELIAAATAKNQNLTKRACPDVQDHPLLRHHALGINRTSKAMVHCVEAMPSTAELLETAARNLPWLAPSGRFHVEHAALARESTAGSIWFPNNAPGVEHLGLGACDSPEGRANCVEVKVHTMDTYVKEKVITGDQRFREETFVIDFLSVDVEGYDWEVLGYGGANWTLGHTRYLEFEYHSQKPWNQVNLSTAVAILETQEFVCYYAGEQKLWRLTGCFQEYMNVHRWSNVACANGALDPELVARMEGVFMRTISTP